MPWKVAKTSECPTSKPWGVIKTTDGSVEGRCHESEADAINQQKALYADESKREEIMSIVELGGKPNKGTSPDKRLTENNGSKKKKKKNNCPEGQHMMPNGECMPDEEMSSNTEVFNDDLDTDIEGPFETWHGVLAIEGIETGDGREFAAGSLEWPDPPLPLLWQEESEPQHMRSIVVGRIDRIERRTTNDSDINHIVGWGVISADAKVTEQMAHDMAGGVSVDVDSVKDSDVEMVFGEDEGAGEENGVVALFGPPPEKVVFHRGRIRGATLVALPAFVEARLHLDEEGHDPFDILDDDVSMSVIGSTDLPIADRNVAWDGSGARRRVFNMCSDGDSLDVACMSRAFLWKDPNADPQTMGAYSLGFVDVIGGALKIVPRGVAATAGGRGVGRLGGVSSDDKSRIQSKICSLYSKVRATHSDWPECPFSGDASLEDMLVAAGGPLYPPNGWFDDPNLIGPTPWTVTDDGRVFGHLALWGTCHTSFSDRCVMPPHEGDYPYFLRRELKTEEGDTVGIGSITLGTGHASLGLGARPAAEHYDNTGTAVVDIAVGEDRYGIWVAGGLRSNVNELQLRELRAASLSGDWRRIGGKLRLVAVLAVNVPGYPVPKTRARFRDDEYTSLVAAGVVTDHRRKLIDPSLFQDEDGVIRVRRVKITV